MGNTTFEVYIPMGDTTTKEQVLGMAKLHPEYESHTTHDVGDTVVIAINPSLDEDDILEENLPRLIASIGDIDISRDSLLELGEWVDQACILEKHVCNGIECYAGLPDCVVMDVFSYQTSITDGKTYSADITVYFTLPA